MSNSVQPQRRQPTRLPHPWDSPGKNTGVGCHFLLHTCTAFQLLSRIKLNVLNTVCKIRSPPMWLSSWSVTCQHKHLKCHLTIFFFFLLYWRIKKRWKEYLEEPYKKDLNELDNYDGVVSHPEPDILESKVKWALGNTSFNKASGCNGIPVELFKTLKDDAIRVLCSIYQQIWKTQQ